MAKYSGPDDYSWLPDNPELGFAHLQRQRYEKLRDYSTRTVADSSYDARSYVNELIAYDEEHQLGILPESNSIPYDEQGFEEFFDFFRSAAEMAATKFLLREARRKNIDAGNTVLLDASARLAIRKFIDAIKTKLDELDIPASKREALFNRLNAFLSEVDRDRTQLEAWYAFAVESARAAKEAGTEFASIQKIIDRICDTVDKAERIVDRLTSPQKRSQIEAPPKRITNQESDLDDELPF